MFQMKPSYKSEVIAVVVTYLPELKVLGQLLDSLIPQVKSVIVVDNGSKLDFQVLNNQHYPPTVKILQLGENSGIAAAHNEGIKYALDSGAGYVLLMDQDSVPAQDMVEKLMSALIMAEKECGSEPIAAGPVCVDSRTSTKSFFVVERNGIPSRWRPVASSCIENFSIEVSFLISSGTLINLTALMTVGAMRSHYFIDHVDTEWCFRAREKGYILLGVPSAVMKHSLGDKVKTIWFFGKRHVSYHTPLRDYYMFRNTLLMLRDVSMPLFWKIHFLWRLVQFAGYFLTFTPSRWERFSKMSLGIYHALKNARGKLDVTSSSCRKIPSTSIDFE